MRKSTRDKQKRLLKELEEHPFASAACKKAGVARSTYYVWRNKSDDFREKADVSEKLGRAKYNDFAESKLIESVNMRHFPAIRYWLNNNHEGYRPTDNRDIEEMRMFMQEYRRTFNNAISYLGPEQAKRVFGYASEDEINKSAQHAADIKREDDLHGGKLK
ncbi:hypothetical protein KC960_04790 [Candidatus Saccharibacteria bacterium]|nr:hypothetical protein [Candidatus Saccharibacteria bacterium]